MKNVGENLAGASSNSSMLKVNSLIRFLSNRGMKKEAKEIANIKKAMYEDLFEKDLLLEKSFHDSVEIIYMEKLGLSPSDNINMHSFKLDLINYCGDKSIDILKYINANGNNDIFDKLDELSYEIESFYLESLEDLMNETLVASGISSMDDFYGVLESEGFDISKTTVYDYLSKNFYREVDNYCIERENKVGPLIRNYCEFINKTYNALKAKRDNFEKNEKYIANIENGCKAYMHLSLDDLNSNFKNYDKETVFNAVTCIINKGSWYALWEFEEDERNFLSVNYPELYKYISEK